MTVSLYPSEVAALRALQARTGLSASRALGALLLKGASWEGWRQANLPGVEP